jgi:hypothetical protein
MRPLMAELNSPQTTRARAIWSWFAGPGPVAFCIGAFAFVFGLPIWWVLALMVALWVLIIAWVFRAPREHLVVSEGRSRLVWRISAVAGMTATVALWYWICLKGPHR